jgi:hypothetical protein
MNENARKLYEDLTNERLEHFDMGRVESCGTPCCILGHALFRMGRLDQFKAEDVDDKKQGYTRVAFESTTAAFEWLGLDRHFGTQLCFPSIGADGPWKNVAFGDSDQKQAAEALKRACALSEGGAR